MKEPQINKVISDKEKGKEPQINKVIAAKRKGKNDKLEKRRGWGRVERATNQ